MTGREPRKAKAAADRRRVAHAATLWGGVALGGTGVLSALAVWHLIRRGRLIRERLDPPKSPAPLGTSRDEPR